MAVVYLYTDGACSGNPGPGGWGAILRYGEFEKQMSGSDANTTNNRMELTAVIRGLQALNRSCEVVVVSDSKYVCDAINQGWLSAWKARGWKKSDKSPVLNPDLWQELDVLLQTHKVRFEWIKGHDGHPFNERCDRLAVEAYQKYLI